MGNIYSVFGGGARFGEAERETVSCFSRALLGLDSIHSVVLLMWSGSCQATEFNADDGDVDSTFGG